MNHFEEDYDRQINPASCNCRRKNDGNCQCRGNNNGTGSYPHSCGQNCRGLCSQNYCRKSEGCCASCCSSCQSLPEVVQTNIQVFNTSTLSYTITKGNCPLERAVSFSVIGIDLPQQGFPIPSVRTISGTIRANGTIYSGEGFRVAHRPGSGSYVITFTNSFSLVDPREKPPTIQIIEDPVEVQSCTCPGSFGESQAARIWGIIDCEGRITAGTKLRNSTEYAFTAQKLGVGSYIVEFRPELNVTSQYWDFGSGNIKVYEPGIQQSDCCNCPPFGDNDEEIIGLLAELQASDSSSFSYQTYEQTTLRKRLADLPVIFNVLVTREV